MGAALSRYGIVGAGLAAAVLVIDASNSTVPVETCDTVPVDGASDSPSKTRVAERIVQLDERFKDIIAPHAALETIVRTCRRLAAAVEYRRERRCCRKASYHELRARP